MTEPGCRGAGSRAMLARMPIAESLLPEFDHEMANTRRVLERVPEDKFAWRPHEKSTTLGRLATHVAELAGFAATALETDGRDIAAQRPAASTAASGAALIETFDRNVSRAREAIAKASDEDLTRKWKLSAGERVIFELPRAGVLRTMVLSHIIHHRGQLTVYLRLNDVPVPGIYGPSADEPLGV
jgi:uncharacterized damage-inducible protein DinB